MYNDDDDDDRRPAFRSWVKVDGIPPDPERRTIAADDERPTETLNEIRRLVARGRLDEVKKLLRDHGRWPVDNPVRPSLWSMLCEQHDDGDDVNHGNATERFYRDTAVRLFGSEEPVPDDATGDVPPPPPPFVDPKHRHVYHLDAVGRAAADRVVRVLGYARPDVTYCPVAYPLVSLFLHFMTERECYKCVTSLLASKRLVFVAQTKSAHEIQWRTAMRVTGKRAGQAADHVAKLCTVAEPAERVYADWIWWIFQGLPFGHLVRVADCYLHEGVKVLYRVAVAVLKVFHEHSGRRESPWAQAVAARGLGATLMEFSRLMPASPRKLLKTAFDVPSLSTGYLRRVFEKIELSLKTRAAAILAIPRGPSDNWSAVGNFTEDVRIESRAIGSRELNKLWSWLPFRIMVYRPILLYTTEEHGCSLTTFYFKVDRYEPTLMIIETCAGDVFGAYCSTNWMERNTISDRGTRNAYFGTGETFLFSLSPVQSKYPWVGIGNDGNVCHTNELFMAADNKMITIGGGNGQAILMDENIRFGKTGSCSTFNNPPLCPGQDFEIKIMEVYGFGEATP